MSAPVIHIHEDDWGMRNLYPVGSLFEASADIGRAAQAGEQNRAPDGVGWTDLYQIRQPSIDYTDVRLALAATASALTAVLPRVRKFAATAMSGFNSGSRDPYGHYDEDAYCFGFDHTCFIKLEPAGDLVKQIWFECSSPTPERLASLRQAVTVIDALAESAIADYWMDCAGRVRDAAFLDAYLRALAGDDA
jgi:hypothetical protein